MRILLLTMNPNLGASARVLQDWLMDARRRGIDASVCVRKYGDLSRWLKMQGFDCHVNEMPWLDRRNLLSWCSSVLRLVFWLRSRRIDVVHCYEDDLWAFAWPLRYVFRAPVIYHFHGRAKREYANWAFG